MSPFPEKPRGQTYTVPVEKELQRWRIDARFCNQPQNYGAGLDVREAADGEWVRYQDAAREIIKLKMRIRRMQGGDE
jgi:hypothetical protein